MHQANDETRIEQYVQQIQRDKGNIQEGVQFLYAKVTPAIIEAIRAQSSSLTPDDIKDITADTWIKIWEKIQEFDPTKAQFATWAAVIAQRKAIDFLRKESRTETVGDSTDIQEAVGVASATENHPMHEALNKELQGVIAGAILQLPEPDRTLYLLYLSFDITYATLADLATNTLGEPMTEKAIQNRMYRARKKLFELMRTDHTPG